MAKKELTTQKDNHNLGPSNLKHNLYNAFLPRRVDWKPVKSDVKAINSLSSAKKSSNQQQCEYDANVDEDED